MIASSIMENEEESESQPKRLRLSGKSSTRATPAWADLDKEEQSDSEDSDEDNLLKTARKFTSKSSYLARDNIHLKRCRKLDDSKSEIVEFHPKSQVALTAMKNGKITLYQIDGKDNAKLQSVKLEKFTIQTAHFSIDGNEVLAGSYRSSAFYSYDLIAGKVVSIGSMGASRLDNLANFKLSPDGKYIIFYGKKGYASMFASQTKEWITNLKMNSEVTDITFGQNSQHLFCHTSNGEILVWDLASRQCMHKFEDDGCLRGSSIDYSRNSQYLACGSDSGVVNVYDTNSLLDTQTPRPLKAITNLRVQIDQVKFNSTSEVLAMISDSKPSAIRLVHLPSLTVFKNFPAFYGNLSKVKCVDFSANSGYMAFASSTGVYLYRMLHYGGY